MKYSEEDSEMLKLSDWEGREVAFQVVGKN